MNRRIFILAFCLLLLQQIPAQKSNTASTIDKVVGQNDTISFLHITDLHTIFQQNTYNPDFLAYRKQKQYDKAEMRLKNFLQEIPQKTKSEMVIATGDLVDFFEVDVRDSKYLESQTKCFAKLIKTSPVPVFCSLGNHDLFSFNWKGTKLEHDQNSSGRARAYWTRNLSCFKNGTTYSKILKVGQTTYRLIFLDNGLYEYDPATKTEIPYIDKSQVCWLKSQLQESKEDVEIILMHIPFNELQNSSESNNELYSILTQDKSVKLILAGHFHKNHVSTYPSVDVNQMTEVQTGTLSQNSNNWRQIRLTEKNIMVSVPGKSEIELTIPVK